MGLSLIWCNFLIGNFICGFTAWKEGQEQRNRDSRPRLSHTCCFTWWVMTSMLVSYSELVARKVLMNLNYTWNSAQLVS